jgi:hypothetical protein
MASIHLQELFMATIQDTKGWTRKESYPYAFGILGGLVEDDKILHFIDYLNRLEKK